MKNLIKNKGVFAAVIAAVAVIVACAVAGALLFFGVIHVNNPEALGYSVKGVDVSAYQGEIDWQTLSEQGISFAFIKATEGSGFVDSRFSYNFSEAQKTNLRIGAYHFFSFESSGKAQAEHFCAAVPKISGGLQCGLPPVVDVEYYGGFNSDNISAEQIRAELRAYVDAVKAHYGVSPIIYVTSESYADIIGDSFADCYLWVRSVYGKPRYVGDTQWTFWQYSNRHVLPGYNGEERYIDMNVFCGSAKEFSDFGTDK